MNYFISYDISSDKHRTKAAKILLREGCVRVQKSVFFAPELPRYLELRLRDELYELLSETEEEDSILIVPIDRDYLDQVDLMNNNKPFGDARDESGIKFF